ncbi:hypothetical protein BJX64DRAFT_288967 [Aspergillus heterothallicus]
MQPPKQTSSPGSLKPLAVVGYALRYPGDATTSEKFWEMLMTRKCASTRYPPDRLNIDAHYNPTTNRADTLSVDGGHFITGDLGAFDPAFFSLTATEAEGMDPQQRLALEVSYQALENAGISLDAVAETKTCVFSGCSANDYGTMHAKDPHAAGKYVAYSQAMCMIANRISWAFNLRGPSANVDTACSSSLVALDMACQSIWSGASTMGLAVGINLIIAREWSNGLDNLGFFSSDNRCFSFGDQANGYSRGEGLGALLVKPLDDAIRDRDTIRAVIRSTLSNQDGRTPGITQPSRTAQQKLIEDTYLHAGISPSSTRYFEAHGTGTAVGDPTEVRGIGAVFRRYRSVEEPLYLGSVKSNIGHLEGGSGIAGVIKVILSLEKGIIPPVVSEAVPWPPGLRRASVSSFGFGGTNSHVIIDDAYHYMKARGLYGNHCTVVSSPHTQSSLRNGSDESEVATGHTNGDSERAPANGHSNGHVNGNGGVAHISRPANGTKHGPAIDTANGTRDHTSSTLANGHATQLADSSLHLLTWSAADKDGLKRLSSDWETYLDTACPKSKEHQSYLSSLAHTLNERRTHHRWRTFAIAENNTPGNELVDSWAPPVQSNADPLVAFVFTGQGAQWPTMGRELLVRYSVYRQSIIEASVYLRSLGVEWDILDVLQADKGTYPIDEPGFAQPLCTAIQVALVDLLETFGLSPNAVVGHSSGEIAAAYCYGAISRQYALKLAYFRGVFAGKLATTSTMSGAMMAVSLSEKDIQPYLAGLREGEEAAVGVVVGCFNSPKSITLSGDRSQLEMLQVRLKEENVLARLLPVPVGYHSFQMQEVAAGYSAAVGNDEPLSVKRATRCRMVSSVHGRWVSRDELSQAKYWVSNLVSPVRFVDAVRKFHSRAVPVPIKKLDGSHRESVVVDVLVELGPHAALRGPCRDTLLDANASARVEYLSALVRNKKGSRTLLDAIGRLHCLGVQVNLAAVNLATGMEKVLTDLPAYSFNHTKSYWREGRTSKGFRFRKYGRHELLGWPEDDWNPLQPKWSNILQSSDPVWVRDHAIDNVTILPGAAMITMAIEAIKQVIEPASSITGFELKNVNFRAALKVVPGGPGVETRFYLHPPPAGSDGNWFDFKLCSYDGSWVTNCDGSIQALTLPKPTEAVSPALADNHRTLISDFAASCTTALDAERFYEMLGSFGYQFGPAFVRISGIACDDASQLLSNIAPYPSENPHWTESYTVHPTTLDGLMQTVPTLRSRGGQQKVPISVPRHVSRAWISSSGLSSEACPGIRVGTKIERLGRQECMSNISAFTFDGEQKLIRLEGVVFANIDSQAPQGDDADNTAPLKCQHIEWKPDLELMTSEEIQRYCSHAAATRDNTEKSTMLRFNIDTVVDGFISRIASVLFATDRPSKESISPAMNSYIDWVCRESKALGVSSFTAQSNDITQRIADEERFKQMCELVACASAEGRLIVATGQALLKYARGQLEACDILSGELVEAASVEAWEQAAGAQCWAAYLDALAHKDPGMKILEVDGATGSIAKSIISTLKLGSAKEAEVPRFAQLHVSGPGRDLDSLRESLGEFSSRVSSIDTDIFHQSASPDYYDLIILYSTAMRGSARESALRKCHSMLEPNGKLVVIEPVAAQPRRHTFIHGLQESAVEKDAGFDTRTGKPYNGVTASSGMGIWDQLLRDAGFSGADLVFPNLTDSPSSEMSIIVSVAEPPDTSLPICPITIVSNPEVPAQGEVAERLVGLLECADIKHYSLEEALTAGIPAESILCVLSEIGQSVLADVTEDKFRRFQQLFSSTAEKVLWVNSGSGDSSSPSFRVVDGLFRVLNSELTPKVFATLSIEYGSHTAELVSRVLRSMLTTSSSPETEYVERSSLLHIPRLTNATETSHSLLEMQPSQAMTLQPWNAEPARKLSIKNPGLLDSIHFVEDTDRQSPLPPHMLEVKVKGVGVNFRDILIMLGRMDQTTVGFECAGIVTRVGEDCGDFKIGDRVVGCEFDTYRSYARLQKDTAVRIPEGISFTEAAAIPINFITAWHALVALSNVQRGERVLVHSAAGGTGQAAVQVAQYFGAEVFATVGTVKKKEFLMERYGIPKTHIFSSRTREFVTGIKHLTGGQGADVILNSLSGDALTASWEIIAPYGRFIEIGKRDILNHRPLDMYHFEKNVTFSAIDVAMMVKERPALVGRALRAVMPLISNGVLRISNPHHVYGIGEMETAFRALQGGQSSGKVVLEMRDADAVRAIPAVLAVEQRSFDANATYVVAGGLGGLGRGIVRWMASCGARYFVLLSRSGANNEEAQAFLQALANSGVTAMTTPCDITDSSMLEAVLGAASHSMPPVKGCIQATMVLQDTVFETMTYKQWTSATAPKITGTWNLHSLLPSNLDFFIMMSSISSIIGNRGQANYAAANSFMDGLAAHRHALGQRATSLNLGLFLDAGVATQSAAQRERYLANLPFSPISERQLHALLAHHCHPGTDTVGGSSEAQTIMGLQPSAHGRPWNSETQTWLARPAFRYFALANTSAGSTGSSSRTTNSGGNLGAELASVSTADEAAPIVTQLLVSKLAKVLGVAREEFDVKKPMHAYGVDSLVAVEMRNWFSKELKADMAIFDMLGGATIEGVGALAAERALAKR